MITYSMTEQEICDEIKKDVFLVDGVINGREFSFARKASKELSKRFGFEGDGDWIQIDTQKYVTPTRKNTVMISYTACSYGRSVLMSTQLFFRYITNTGKIQWIMKTTDKHTLFTSHFFDRMLERCGMNMTQALEYISTHPLMVLQDYEYNGTIQKAFALGDLGLVFCDITDSMIICKTFVSGKMLWEEQDDLRFESMVGSAFVTATKEREMLGILKESNNNSISFRAEDIK